LSEKAKTLGIFSLQLAFSYFAAVKSLEEALNKTNLLFQASDNTYILNAVEVLLISLVPKNQKFNN